jgi:hypothetical protein
VWRGELLYILGGYVRDRTIDAGSALDAAQLAQTLASVRFSQP